MFITLSNGRLLNVTKISTITTNDWTINYTMINGTVIEDTFDNEIEFNTQLDFIKEKLVVR